MNVNPPLEHPDQEVEVGEEIDVENNTLASITNVYMSCAKIFPDG